MSARRWKLTALLAAGVAIGILMVGTPAGAHIGSVTHLWNHHIKPKADKRYFRYEAKVPAGKTLTGTWVISENVDAADEVAQTAISFALPLSAAPTAIVVPNGGPVPAGCSGTVGASSWGGVMAIRIQTRESKGRTTRKRASTRPHSAESCFSCVLTVRVLSRLPGLTL